MSRFVATSAMLLGLAAVVACSDATGPQGNTLTPSLASGSTGGGGGGGGAGGGSVGGSGGSARPCAIITFDIVNNAVLSTSVAPFWQPNMSYVAQAIGSTEKSCDAIPGAVMKFADLTGTADGCDVSVPQFVGATYLKYGLKPMSRYDVPFIYYTGADCLGKGRIIKATLSDQPSGAVISTATITWTPQ